MHYPAFRLFSFVPLQPPSPHYTSQRPNMASSNSTPASIRRPPIDPKEYQKRSASSVPVTVPPVGKRAKTATPGPAEGSGTTALAERLKRLQEEMVKAEEELAREAEKERKRVEEEKRREEAQRRAEEEKLRLEEEARQRQLQGNPDEEESNQGNATPIKTEFAEEFDLRKGGFGSDDSLRARLSSFHEAFARATRCLSEEKLSLFLKETTEEMTERVDELMEVLNLDSGESEYEEPVSRKRGKRRVVGMFAMIRWL